jgi:hypothetical protein
MQRQTRQTAKHSRWAPIFVENLTGSRYFLTPQLQLDLKQLAGASCEIARHERPVNAQKHLLLCDLYDVAGSAVLNMLFEYASAHKGFNYAGLARMLLLCLLCITTLPATGCSATTSYFSYHVTESIPHDTSSFTEGLCIRESDGALLESIGLTKLSKVIAFARQPRWSTTRPADDSNNSGSNVGSTTSTDDAVTSPSLKTLTSLRLDSKEFAEGLATVDQRVFQLVYKRHKIHEYDHQSLQVSSVRLCSIGGYSEQLLNTSVCARCGNLTRLDDGGRGVWIWLQW